MVAMAALVVLALIVWAADPRSTAGAGDVTRFAGDLWLLALRDPLRVAGGTLVIPPLGLTVLVGLLLVRATAIVARSEQLHDKRSFGVVVAAVTLPFAVLATVLALIDHSGALRPTPGAAFVCAALVGGVSAAVGAAVGGGRLGPVWRGLPAQVRLALAAAGSAGGVLVAAAVVLLTGSLIAHAHDIGTIVSSYRGGAGEFSMLLLSVLYAPNAVVFASSYIIGPGFAVGAGTSVAVGGSHLAAAPAFPLLAAAPSGSAPLVARLFCGLAIVGAGVAAGWRIARPATPAAALPVRQQLRVVALAAAFAGVAASAAAAYAGGPAGPGRLSAVGPSPWQVGLLAALELGTIAGLVVLAMRWRRDRRQVIDLTGEPATA
jgi:Family of unknown function (DUF6350)